MFNVTECKWNAPGFHMDTVIMNQGGAESPNHLKAIDP